MRASKRHGSQAGLPAPTAEHEVLALPYRPQGWPLTDQAARAVLRDVRSINRHIVSGARRWSLQYPVDVMMGSLGDLYLRQNQRGRVIAYAVIVDGGYLAWMGVDSRYRRSGLAQELLGAAPGQTPRLNLHVRASNLGARALFTGMSGVQAVQTEATRYDDQEAGIGLQLTRLPGAFLAP